MRKLLLCGLLILLSASVALAQDIKSNTWHFGIMAGGAYSKAATSAFGQQSLSGPVTSFPWGVYTKTALSKDLAIQAALLYINKGGENTKATISGDVALYYLQLPLDLVYMPAIANHRIFVAAGPYLAYGLGGRFNGEAGNAYAYKAFSDNPTKEEGNVLNRLDWGADIRLGYRLTPRISVAAFADIEINNALSITNEKTDYFRNRTYGISISYRLGN